MSCLDEGALRRFLSGQLSPEEMSEAEAHLAQCDACAQRLSSLASDRETPSTSIPSAGPRPATPKPAAPAEPKPLPARPEAPDGELARGTAVGRYLVLKKLGEGGMGAVYEAYDPELSRKVALKLLRAAKGGAKAQDQTRLLREAQAMARVSHPNVLAVHDVGTHGERVFLAMELVDGGNLKEWLSERPRSWREVRDAYSSAGRGLAAAHAAGLIHRDFKPANVLVGKDGRIQVTDFGLARLADGASAEVAGDGDSDITESTHSGAFSEALTKAGSVMGTPMYMSPEQHLGLPADARSDQFSFCAALYLALYRRRPFDPDRLASAAAQLEGTEAPTRKERVLNRLPFHAINEPPRDVRVPAFLRKAVMRGLSLIPASRYPSMDALLADLSKDPWATRKRSLAIGGAALVLAGGGAGIVQVQRARAQLCTGAEAELKGVWDAELHPRLEQAFAATRHPLASQLSGDVEGRLDAYAAQWIQAHGAACRATRIRGEQTEQVLALRMVCLERRRKDLQALSRVLLQADPKAVDRAVDAVTALPGVKGCADVEGLSQKAPLPDDPGVRHKVEAAQTELAEAKAQRAAGRYPRALELAKRIVPEADALGYRPLQAEAYDLLGWILDATGEWAEGQRYLQRALWAAEASRDDELRVAVANKLVFNLGYHQNRYQDGEAWASFARACIERLGGNEALEADVAQSLASVYAAEFKAEPAREEFERALALVKKLYGPEHPKVAYVLSNLGSLYLQEREWGKAADVLAQALALIERTKGPEHVSAGVAHGNLATALAGIGRFDEAHVHADRSLQIRIAAMGPEHPAVADALDIAGNVFVTEGRFKEGAQKYAEALALKEKKLGPEAPDLAYSVDGIGQAHLDAGEFAKAIPWYERSLRLRKDDRAGSAESRFGLARSIYGASPSRRREALALAEVSRSDFAALGMQNDAARVEQWLSKVNGAH